MTVDDFDVIRPSEERPAAYCENPTCVAPLGTDYALLIVGVFVRRFCNATCVAYALIGEGAIDFGDDDPLAGL
jgi:hypothetical protein